MASLLKILMWVGTDKIQRVMKRIDNILEVFKKSSNPELNY